MLCQFGPKGEKGPAEHIKTWRMRFLDRVFPYFRYLRKGKGLNPSNFLSNLHSLLTIKRNTCHHVNIQKFGGGGEQTAVITQHNSCRPTDISLPNLKLDLLSSRGSDCRQLVGLQDKSWLLFLWPSPCPLLHLCALQRMSSKSFSSFGFFTAACSRGF